MYPKKYHSQRGEREEYETANQKQKQRTKHIDSSIHRLAFQLHVEQQMAILKKQQRSRISIFIAEFIKRQL